MSETTKSQWQQLEHLQTLAQQYGKEVAKEEAFNQLVAAASWLRSEYGPELAYGVLQAMADQMITGASPKPG